MSCNIGLFWIALCVTAQLCHVVSSCMCSLSCGFITKELRLQKMSGEYEPSWVKFKYGAWYLPPKTWEKRQWDDQLIDPKALKDQELSEAKKKSHNLVS